MDLHEMISTEEIHLKKLSELVQKSIDEEQLLSSRLVELEIDKDITLGQRLADKISDFGGSWKFIISFGTFIFLWILTNVYFLKTEQFDPYPFIFLNLILSCLAALQAPVIMMSQNRQEEKDRRRGRGDFLINLKAEMEIRNLHQKIDLLMAEQMQSLFKVQQTQLELLEGIKQKLNK